MALQGRHRRLDRGPANGRNSREAVIEQTQTLIGAPPSLLYFAFGESRASGHFQLCRLVSGAQVISNKRTR